MQLYCDNKSTMSIAHNENNMIGPNIEINKHFIKYNNDIGLVVTSHIPTKLQLANISSKRLP